MYPKVNQNIKITVVSKDMSSKSIVADVGDSEIQISIPLDREILGLLSLGTKLEVTYITGENKYQFRSEIVGISKDTIPLLRLSKPEENKIFKIQERENFRVNSNLRLLVEEKEAITVNISAGGALFSTGLDFPYHEGEEISARLFLANQQSKVDEPITFHCKIIRITLLKDQERKHVAIQFSNLNQHDQKKIIQHCFEKQRQIRMKVR
ncbi:flagellar brake domain-containing protein [Bacillus sp. 1P10SD]|uniref:flagellar brake protein n=1 Tax=Bacillus sp. 1P10SD TaxID=3132265 RepID=UPI0039A4233D